MDGETGQILYGKNETKQMYPASITKIATAIYALEKGKLQDQVTISEEATNVAGTRVYLEPGEVVSLEKLDHGYAREFCVMMRLMLLPNILMGISLCFRRTSTVFYGRKSA